MRTTQEEDEDQTSRGIYFLTVSEMIVGKFRSHYMETDLVKAALVLRKKCTTDAVL